MGTLRSLIKAFSGVGHGAVIDREATHILWYMACTRGDEGCKVYISKGPFNLFFSGSARQARRWREGGLSSDFTRPTLYWIYQSRSGRETAACAYYSFFFSFFFPLTVTPSIELVSPEGRGVWSVIPLRRCCIIHGVPRQTYSLSRHSALQAFYRGVSPSIHALRFCIVCCPLLLV
jgi:hypothetical protein